MVSLKFFKNQNQCAQVKDQQEAERKKQASMEIQQALEEQTKVIQEKKSSVMSDLSKVEPAVLDAQQGMRSIRCIDWSLVTNV